MNIISPIILGIARGGDPGELKTFVLSLRKTGYAGDVCLFVDDLAPETLRFLHDHRVQLQAFPKRYFVQARRFFLRSTVNLLPRKIRDDAKITFSQYYLHLNDARWVCYFNFLRATRGLYSHVMFTDVKDVVFQRNPFDFEWKASLCTFYTAPDFFIRDDTCSSGRLRKGFGESETRKLKDKRVVGSGVTFAEIDAALEYLHIICHHKIRVNARGSVDVGVHNYVLHHHLLTSSYVYDYPETPVLHLGRMPPEKLDLNEQGLVLNGSGRIVNVVHQYFPYRKAMAKGLELITAAV